MFANPKWVWQISVFTSELSVLFGGPMLILGVRTLTGRIARAALLLLRVSCLWVLILAPPDGTYVRLGLGLAALLAYAIEISMVITDRGVCTMREKMAYSLSNISLINYCLDVPGFADARFAIEHRLVLLANLVLLPAMVLGFVAAYDYARAWQCYSGYAEYTEFNGGMCLTNTYGITVAPAFCDGGGAIDRLHSACHSAQLNTAAIHNPLFHVGVFVQLYVATLYFGVLPYRLRLLSEHTVTITDARN
jgi:hypothetical protein